MFKLDKKIPLDNEKPQKSTVDKPPQKTQMSPPEHAKPINEGYIETLAREFLTKYRKYYNKYVPIDGEPKPHWLKCYEWILKQGWS